MLLDHQLVEECLVYGDGNQIVSEIYPNDKYAKLNHITNIVEELEHIINEVNSHLQINDSAGENMIISLDDNFFETIVI